MNATTELIQQHLIDPEICIRCNTCEATCPVGAITHDSRNYVVIADKCNLCMACVPPCPTGSIDNWRSMPKAAAYSIEEQLTWDTLPAPLSDEELQAAGALAEAVGLPASSMSFHLAQLSHAGLIRQERQGRSLIYSADYAAMNGLIGYLMENCCAGAVCGSDDASSGCAPAISDERKSA